jgi:hypothetical protein
MVAAVSIVSNPATRRADPTVTLKIIADRADNGNDFLCRHCVHGHIRSGQQTEMEVWCSNQHFVSDYEASERVNFSVTRCTGFTRQDPSRPTRAALKSMERQAHYIVRSDEGRGVVLIPPDVAKQRDIWQDYD